MSLTPWTDTHASGARVDSTTETYDLQTHGRKGIILTVDVTALGNGHSFVDGAAPTLPVVIDSTHNVFSYDGSDFTIASGTYSTLAALATAIGAATKTGPVAFSTLVTVTVVDDHLRFTSVASGVNVKIFDVGSTHDVLLAATGITATWTIVHTQAAGADGAASQTITIQGKDEASGKFVDMLASAAESTVSTRQLKVYPGLTAVTNLVASDILPSVIRVSISHTTNNSVTRTIASQLVV